MKINIFSKNFKESKLMKLFSNLAVYIGIGFLMSFIVNKTYVYLVVSVIMFIIGIILGIINSKRK